MVHDCTVRNRCFLWIILVFFDCAIFHSFIPSFLPVQSSRIKAESFVFLHYWCSPFSCCFCRSLCACGGGGAFLFLLFCLLSWMNIFCLDIHCIVSKQECQDPVGHAPKILQQPLGTAPHFTSVCAATEFASRAARHVHLGVRGCSGDTYECMGRWVCGCTSVCMDSFCSNNTQLVQENQQRLHQQHQQLQQQQ